MLRILLTVFFVSAAVPALAAPRTAPPPPSGEVIHLFGPQGVLTNAIPLPGITPPAAPPAGPSGAPGTVASATPAPPAATTAATPAAAQSYPEPTLGAVLHQMFITGDPNAGPGFPQGRKGN
jgi:hypothetical protein